MPRGYRHTKMYEKEILELQKQGLSHRQIAEKLGLTLENVHGFFKLYRRKLKTELTEEKINSPGENETELPPSIQQSGKLIQLQYELADKERYIKRLEMENELMRDFLSLTGKK